MIFKKFRGQIFDVDLTPKEQKAMEDKVNQMLVARHREFADDVDYMILYILHRYFGFGLIRLRRFYEAFMIANEALIKRYEMSDAGTYIARKEMNAIGCNVEQWNNERSG